MKVESSNDKLILYIRKEMVSNLNFDDIEALEIYFKDLITKLHDIYDINISGFYNIYVYIDKIYGIVLELIKEDLDYYMGSNQIEMRIIPEHVTFLYEIDDIKNIKNTKLYLKNNKYYLKMLGKIKKNDYFFILENSKIIYSKTDSIIKYATLINDFNFNKNMI